MALYTRAGTGEGFPPVSLILQVFIYWLRFVIQQAFDLGLPPGVTRGGVDSDALTNGEENAPSIFSSAGLSAGAFLKSPYKSWHPAMGNLSAPEVQVCHRIVRATHAHAAVGTIL